MLQLLNIHNADISDADYLKVIHYKTAKLFEAATRLGAIINQASIANETALAEYGMRLGTAFQLIDDVLDLSGDAEVIGKNLGDDLAEGKPTLPLLYAMQHGNAQQSQIIREVIEQKNGDDGSALADVLKAVVETGALVHVKKLAKNEADLATKAIAHFADSPYKAALLNLADFAVNRSY